MEITDYSNSYWNQWLDPKGSQKSNRLGFSGKVWVEEGIFSKY